MPAGPKKKGGGAHAVPPPPPPPSSGDDLAVVVDPASFEDGTREDESTRDLTEVIASLDAEPDPFPETLAPTPSTKSVQRTVAFLNKHGIDFHDNEDGSFSVRAGHGSLRGGALACLKFAFRQIPHPRAQVWTEHEIEAAILEG